MIKKERLEELIEQGATICNAYKDWDNVWHCRFGKVIKEENSLLFKENGSSLSVIMHNAYNLYERKEQAEWEWEFGCIERTERLELPTWEEFKNKDCVSFITKTGKKVNIFNYDFDNEIYISDTWYISEKFEYSQGGYTLACRKAKELFLGGGDGDIR